MPLAASLKIPEIPGTGIQVGREGEITVIAMEHEVRTDFEPTLGVPLRTRVHDAIVIRKNLDFATPHLIDAHAKGTVFSDWELRLFHMVAGAGEVAYYTIKLTGARVIAIEMSMADHTDPEVREQHEYEEVAFAYEGIAWKSAGAPSKGPEAGTYDADSSGDRGTFVPDWANEAAKAQVASLRDAAVKAAKEQYKKELDEIEKTGKLPGE